MHALGDGWSAHATVQPLWPLDMHRRRDGLRVSLATTTRFCQATRSLSLCPVSLFSLASSCRPLSRMIARRPQPPHPPLACLLLVFDVVGISMVAGSVRRHAPRVYRPWRDTPHRLQPRQDILPGAAKCTHSRIHSQAHRGTGRSALNSHEAPLCTLWLLVLLCLRNQNASSPGLITLVGWAHSRFR